MEAAFEAYIKHATKAPCEEDEDVINYNKVEVTKDITPDKGPKAGEKFMRVDLHVLTGDAVFRLKSGGCRVVSVSPKRPPKFSGEFSTGAVNV